MGRLLRSLGQDDARDNAGRDAAIAQQRQQQSALRQPIAVHLFQTLDRADGGVIDGVVLDLLGDESIQRLGDIVLIAWVFQLRGHAPSRRGDGFVVGLRLVVAGEIITRPRRGVQARRQGSGLGVACRTRR